MSNWPFDDLNPYSYDFIMADPPWRFENWSKKGEMKNPSQHYETMPLEDIKALPVGDLASGDTLLWLWCTNAMLREGFDVLDAWCFKYVTAGVWHKRTKHWKTHFGTGYVLRGASEPFLIGKIGKPKTTKGVRSLVEGVVRENSRKPEESYRAAQQLMPNARRADLFSRQTRDGWDNWGKERGKFDVEN